MSRLSSAFTRLLLIGALSLAGVGSGLAVSIDQSFPAVQVSAALAQAGVTDVEVLSYARSVLQMESSRSEAYTEVKNMMMDIGLNIGDFEVSCTNTRLSDIPRSIRRQVRGIIVDFCNSAADIVEENGLGANRFNEITAAHRRDQALAGRIQRAMIDLQQQ
ncbi:MAG: DUF4168 domain-containing protein [Cyanobacteria bacterium P01_H01_bin.119]